MRYGGDREFFRTFSDAMKFAISTGQNPSIIGREHIRTQMDIDYPVYGRVYKMNEKWVYKGVMKLREPPKIYFIRPDGSIAENESNKKTMDWHPFGL